MSVRRCTYCGDPLYTSFPCACRRKASEAQARAQESQADAAAYARIAAEAQQERLAIEQARLAATAVCNFCGQPYNKPTHQLPPRGTKWTGLLAAHASSGVCPLCCNNGRLRGEVVPWTDSDWLVEYERALASVPALEKLGALFDELAGREDPLFADIRLRTRSTLEDKLRALVEGADTATYLEGLVSRWQLLDKFPSLRADIERQRSVLAEQRRREDEAEAKKREDRERRKEEIRAEVAAERAAARPRGPILAGVWLLAVAAGWFCGEALLAPVFQAGGLSLFLAFWVLALGPLAGFGSGFGVGLALTPAQDRRRRGEVERWCYGLTYGGTVGLFAALLLGAAVAGGSSQGVEMWLLTVAVSAQLTVCGAFGLTLVREGSPWPLLAWGAGPVLLVLLAWMRYSGVVSSI